MENLGSWIDYGILGLLLVMSVVLVAVGIERFSFYRQIRLSDYADPSTLEIDLTERLFVLGSIASNAPYVGLLGTVLGIMLTFYQMGLNAAMDAGQIMTGLSMALKATALGLVVALLAVVTYNTLLRRVKVLSLRWQAAQGTGGHG